MSGSNPPRSKSVEAADRAPATAEGALREPGVRVHLPLVEGDRGAGSHLTKQVEAAALALGFVRLGVTTVAPFAAAGSHLSDWLERGYAGEMAYLAGTERHDPRALMADARTLISVALGYGEQAGDGGDGDEGGEGGGEPRELTGSVARYARGADYHGVMKSKLRELADEIATLCGRPVLARACVDTAPLLEHEAAARGGVGFVAKNTLTIVPGYGSYVLLGELLVDVELVPSGLPERPRCGACRACLDACPTGAFVDATLLDARRCISYLTIELQGSIPVGLRSAIGTRVFGCDVCQEVCPFNARSEDRAFAPELAVAGNHTNISLPWLLQLRSGDYRRLVKGSSMRRVTRQQLQRNAAVALGNTGERAAVAPLVAALRTNQSPMVREHAAWALGELGFREAAEPLTTAAADTDESVRESAALALARLR